MEETQEHLTDRTLEGLADVLEMLHALAPLHDLTPDGWEARRARKTVQRGGFAGQVWLKALAGQSNAC